MVQQQNKINRMKDNKTKWGDIVSQVETANLTEIVQVKEKQKDINRKYMEQLDQEIVNRKNKQKNQERQIIQKQVQQQQQNKQVKRRLNIKHELEYQDSNLQLIDRHRQHKQPNDSYGEHPFIKLVDGEQKRKQTFRQHMKQQNEVNELQQKIKKEQRKQFNKIEEQFSHKFIDHVDKFYERKKEDRNLFKQRYLKITNPEKSLLQAFALQKNSSLEKEYQSFLNHQISHKQQCERRKEEVDIQLLKLNRHIDHPDSSPAFIGRTPVNYDRKKQLEYLDKGLSKQLGQLNRRFKTEGNEQSELDDKRNTAKVQELSLLEKYYTKNYKISQTNEISKSQINQSNLAKNNESLSAKYDSVQKLNAKIDLGQNRARFASEASENRPEKKSYLTFDIIQQRKKLVYL